MGILSIQSILILIFASSTSWVLGHSQDFQGNLENCPSLCECNKFLTMKRVSCNNKRLYDIIPAISVDVQVLELKNNFISKLDRRQFSKAGLTRLRYLDLSFNSISEIDSLAFENLLNLTIIDLSKNHIDFIHAETFNHIPSLRILNLAGNKFNLVVPMILSMSLTDLNLSNCRIIKLSNTTFQGLGKLEKLNLSNNMLTEVSKYVFYPLKQLKMVELKHNYWVCGRVMLDLISYFKREMVYFDQICDETFRKLIENPNRRITGPNSNEQDFITSWDPEAWSLHNAESDSNNEEIDIIDPSDEFSNTWNETSPLWFLIIGFLLGSVVTYLWLSTTISCLLPRIRNETGNSESNLQRESLLRHLWYQENSAEVTERLPSSLVPSCPGTPPPPYREVISHRNIYPTAPPQTMLTQ